MQVRLISTGKNNVQIINILRQITDLSIAECKSISENPDLFFSIKEEANIDLVNQILNKLGAKIEIYENDIEDFFEPEKTNNANEDLKEFQVTINSFSDKLTTIKLMRSYTQLPLSVCNEITEKLPAKFLLESTLSKITAFKNEASNNSVNIEFNENKKAENKSVEKPKTDSEFQIYKFYMTSSGSNKIQILKILRDLTDAQMFECKKIVDFTPSIFFLKARKEVVNEYIKKFRSAGATISFEITDIVTAGFQLYTYKSIKSEKNIIPNQKTVQQANKINERKIEAAYVAPKKADNKGVSYEQHKNDEVKEKKSEPININKSKTIDNNFEKRKENLRNLVKQQDINKAKTSAFIWAEIFSIISVIFILLNENSGLIIFIVASIVISTVFKNKGKIVIPKYRLTGTMFVFLCYVQTLGFVYLYQVFAYNAPPEFLLRIILLNPNVIIGTVIGLVVAYLMSCKLTDLKPISNELDKMEDVRNKSVKKNLQKIVSHDKFYSKYSSKHKQKYSTQKHDLKMKIK